MADTLRRGQVSPPAQTWVTVLSANGPTVISTLRATNLGGVGSSPDRIDVRHVQAGEPIADKQYLVSNVPVPVGWPYAATEGWTMLGSDVLQVRSRLGMTAFNVFGVEKI